MGEYDSGYENYIDSLIREIEKLQDENDKLREQVSSLVGRSFRTADKMSCIEADNAKLRELVRWMYDRMDESCAVQYPYAPAPISYDRLMQALARARELGVEVAE